MNMPIYPLNIPEEKHKKLRDKLFNDGNKSIKWLLEKAIDDYIS